MIHERTGLLIGEEGLARLAAKRVLIAGLGGVGGFVCEALARANVGKIDLLDHDTVAESNINRQLIALHSTVGQAKAEVMQARIHDINPAIQTRALRTFLHPESTADLVSSEPYDFVVDCIDSIVCKASLVQQAQLHGVPVASSMGAGGRVDVNKVKVTTLAKTETCPLAREMRRHLRKLGASLDYPVVVSTEQPKKGTTHQPVGTAENPGRPRSVNGTVSWMPALFGIMLGGHVLNLLLAEDGGQS